MPETTLEAETSPAPETGATQETENTADLTAKKHQDAAIPAQANASALVTYGHRLLASGNPDAARRAYTRALRLGASKAEVYTGLGLAAERQNLIHEARRWFERAADHAPNSEIAQNNLGAVLYRLKDYQGARHAFRAAFALSSGANRVAEHNLGLAEQAIEREIAETPVLAENPFTVQRIGSGHFRLIQTEKLEQDG